MGRTPHTAPLLASTGDIPPKRRLGLWTGPFFNLGRRFRRCRLGTAAVEFALITPVLLIIIMGLVDFGLAMFKKMELTGAVRSGAQLAMMDSSNTTVIKDAVVDASGNSITSSDVSTTSFCECADESTVVCGETCGDGSSNRTFMTITASQSFSGLFLTSAISITGTITVRVN